MCLAIALLREHPSLCHLQTAAWCFGGIGAFLVLHKACRQAWLRHQERRARERVRRALDAAAAALANSDKEAAAGGGEGVGLASGGADADSSGGGHEQEGVCVVCLSLPSSMVFVKCGHLCCCPHCCANLKRCPVCRVTGTAIKVFRP